MSIRILALYLCVTGLCLYAWKDWFKSLCALIVMMAVIEHGDMPKTMFGIQGLNVWNVLFLAVALAWLANRRRQGLTWDLPRNVSLLLLMFLGVILVGVLRAAFDLRYMPGYTVVDLVSEELINSIKWVLPGVLIFDGSRTRKQVITAHVCLLVLYLLLAGQAAKHVQPEAVFGSSNVIIRARGRLQKNLGYHATDLSVMLGGASWGLFATLPLVRAKRYKLAVLGATALVAYSQALTGGRAGYVAWGTTGLILCLLKWRRYLLLAPVVVLLLPIVLPGATARMLQGFGQTNAAGQTTVDEASVTSGRNLIWPPVIKKIQESPWIGYGRRAMQRTGLQQSLLQQYGAGEAVGHPHNMYLETLLDNGILGALLIWSFYALMVFHAARLFRSNNRLYSAIAGLALALLLTNLIGGLSGQHYFPLEHTLGIWVAIFLMLRVRVEELRADGGGEARVLPPVAVGSQTVIGAVG